MTHFCRQIGPSISGFVCKLGEQLRLIGILGSLLPGYLLPPSCFFIALST